jgi:hypothetical protein
MNHQIDRWSCGLWICFYAVLLSTQFNIELHNMDVQDFEWNNLYEQFQLDLNTYINAKCASSIPTSFICKTCDFKLCMNDKNEFKIYETKSTVESNHQSIAINKVQATKRKIQDLKNDKPEINKSNLPLSPPKTKRKVNNAQLIAVKSVKSPPPKINTQMNDTETNLNENSKIKEQVIINSPIEFEKSSEEIPFISLVEQELVNTTDLPTANLLQNKSHNTTTAVRPLSQISTSNIISSVDHLSNPVLFFSCFTSLLIGCA